MSQKRNPFITFILTGVTLGFGLVTRMLPFPLARRLGIFFADLAYYAIPRIRKVGMSNLDLAYGDTISKEEKKRILKGSVRSIGLVASEFSRIPKLNDEKFRDQITVKGREYIEESGNALCVSGHLGSWEWIPPTISTLGIPTAIIVRPLDDPRLNDIIEKIRSSTGVTVLGKVNATRNMVKLLQEGYSGGILADQSPHNNGVPATFFGTQSWATVGPAIIAQKAGIAVHPVTMVRDEKFNYTLEFYPEIQMDDTGDRLADLVTNTQKIQDMLEHFIRKHPEQWLWFHRRWKSRERLAVEWEERLATMEKKYDAQEPQESSENEAKNNALP